MPVILGIVMMGGWVFLGLIAASVALACYEWVKISIRTPWPAPLIVAGLFYLLMTYSAVVLVRHIPENGLYLTLTLMIAVWSSDSLAYLVGRTIGGPKMSPTISPKKTWSGMAGALIGAAMALVACLYFAPALSSWLPNTLSVTLSTLPVLAGAGIVLGYIGQAGDLFISAIKRQAQMKDTGAIIPGHGGLLDRIDSLLLMAPAYLAFCKYGL